MIELLVFDCDGTLVQTADIKIRGYEYIGNLFSPEAGAAMRAYQLKTGGINRVEKFKWLYKEVLKRDITADDIAELSEKFSNFCQTKFLSAALMPGTIEVLTKWFGKIPMYVASGAPENELEDVLSYHDIKKYFAGVYGGSQPKAMALRQIIQKSAAASSLSVMLGDSPVDLEAAEKNGLLFYGIGATMQSCGHPWHADLTQFNSWLVTEINRWNNVQV